MAMLQEPKLTFIQSQLVARVSFWPLEIMNQSWSPKDWYHRVHDKFESLKKAGEVVYYEVDEEILERVLHRILSNEKGCVLKDTFFQAKLALGCPDLPGVSIESSQISTMVCRLTMTISSENIRSWGWDWLELFVRYRLKELAISKVPDPVFLRMAWYSILNGMEVKNFEIPEKPEVPLFIDGRESLVKVMDDSRALLVEVWDAFKLSTEEGKLEIMASVQAEGSQLVSDGSKLKIMRYDLLKNFTEISHGPEMLGLHLPRRVLAAICVDGGEQKKKNNVTTFTERPSISSRQGPMASAYDYLGKGLLEVEISLDALEATISVCPLDLYDRNFSVNKSWLDQEAQRLGLMIPDDECLFYLTDAIKHKRNLVGLTLVKAFKGQPASLPLIRLYNEYKPNEEDDEWTIENLNFHVVSTGELLAEIEYSDLGKPDIDIFGNKKPVDFKKPVELVVGRGVVEREGGKFYADWDGIPTIRRNKIFMNRVLKFEGNVNRQSGNIEYDGAVHIFGDIEEGARVFATGPVTVEGSIRGGSVRSGSDIIIHECIETGIRGIVYCQGRLVASIVENSIVIVEGDFYVQTRLINSQVVVGGMLRTSARGGLIAGGSVVCSGSLIAHKIGNPNIQPSEIFIGSEYTIERAIQIKRRRIKRILRLRDRAEKELSHIDTKEYSTVMSLKLKFRVRQKIRKCNRLESRIRRQINHLRKHRLFDEKSLIVVKETLMADTYVQVCDYKEIIQFELSGAVISCKKVDGKHINPLRSWREVKNELLDDELASGLAA